MKILFQRRCDLLAFDYHRHTHRKRNEYIIDASYLPNNSFKFLLKRTTSISSTTIFSGLLCALLMRNNRFYAVSQTRHLSSSKVFNSCFVGHRRLYREWYITQTEKTDKHLSLFSSSPFFSSFLLVPSNNTPNVHTMHTHVP